MPEKLLSPNERQQLEALVAGDTPEAERRRARLFLLLDDGQPTQQAAQMAGITPGRARHWRGAFRSQGMQIFPSSRSASEPAPRQEAGSKVETVIAPRVASPIAGFMLEAATLETPGVEADDLLSEAGRKVLRYHFAQMLLHEEGTRLGEDIEELHDMRVATRRMRAAFEIFADAYTNKTLKKLLKELRATGRSLGKVRDLDVFMEKAQHYLATIHEDRHVGLDLLLAGWKEQREAARVEMLVWMDSKEYIEFKRKFNLFLNTPGAGARATLLNTPVPTKVRELAPVLIYTRLATVRAYAPYLDNAPVELLHALRIEFKKLRYTVEYFQEALGKRAKDVIDLLKQMQDHLGDLNDAQVAALLLSQFIEEWEARQAELPIEERQTIDEVHHYLAYRQDERQHLMETFQEEWQKHFWQPAFRHYLAEAVAVL